MIALSAYKLANYLVDMVQNIPRKNDAGAVLEDCKPEDVKWKDVYDLSFAEVDPSRNKCFVCIDKKARLNFFFKQSKAFSEDNLKDIRSETAFYLLVKKIWNEALGDHVPEHIFYDDYNGVIVTTYWPELRLLTDLPSVTYKQAGAALLQLHKTCSNSAIQDILPKLQWIVDFSTFEPPVISMTRSDINDLKRRGNIYVDQLLAYLADHCDEIRKWRAEWAANVKGLIHGDANENNFGKLSGKIKIVDFEFVSYGAWFWDHAAFIASLLVSTTVPTIVPPRVGRPPADVYPIIVNFCSGYGLDVARQKQVLRWSGIYLLQLFISTNEFFHLQFGLALIEHTEECHKKIFPTAR